ncbi:DEAD/DEAH box helicase [Bacillus altitudinis]|uniref:DEAD/DEAH box helicase n=1 Tax=Bacillus altitudinis TaxID=293387 RepID=UPI001F423DCE|nr:DEAD/DEAH box helicase family protein [Bacillus altitudinis]
MSSIIWEQRSRISSKLRPYQIKAIETSLSYIKSSSDKQALIKMPTGTGKTFVIGVLSLLIKGCNNVLIVSPSSAIREQLYKEIRKMWEKIDIDLEIKKSIECLFPKNISELLDKQGNKVFITTIQALTQIKLDDENKFNDLKDQVDLILFDEGHKEPANTWSEAIRSFKQKTILFTATPIRNDYQSFNIDEKFFFNYSIRQAFDDKIIRRPEFKSIEQNLSSSEMKIKDFINKTIEFKRRFAQEKNYEPKVIIRFSFFIDLEVAIDYLEGEKEKAIAIHERFKNTKNNNYKFKDVPDENDAIYWLAQNKLVEGIDDSKFAILAIYDGFDNARLLIQQIGRTLRKESSDSKIDTSWVIINSTDRYLEDIWTTYLEYESDKSQRGKLPTNNYKSFFKSYLSNQPDYIYGSQKFLKKFDDQMPLEFEDTLYRYSLPLKVNIFSLKERMTSDFEFSTLIDKIISQKELSNEFVVNKNIDESESMYVVIYTKFGNSSILSNESFIEVKLGLFFIWINENYLYYYDTNNYIPSIILELSDPIDTNKLQLLFNEDTEFTQVTLRNGIVSKNNIHRQVINSENIENIAPNMTDKYNFCTTITGTVNEAGNKGRRYIGFSNSRVSDDSNYVKLADYLDWIKKIASKILNEVGAANNFFQRYSPIVGIPENTNPILITFNFNDFADHLVNENGEKVSIEELNYRIEDSKTQLKVNGENACLMLRYENKRYHLSFEDNSLNNNYRFNEDITTNEYSVSKNETLISYLNRYQDFQIVTSDATHIYYKKEFIKCDISYDDMRLNGIFREYELLDNKKINSEKGDLSVQREEWAEDSLFYLVSSLGKDLDEKNEIKESLIEMDYLICTDLGSEIADFIGLNTKDKKIYFIHCKAKNASRSASAFQDIVSQIIKSLDYSHPLSNRKPKGVDNWNKDWNVKEVTRKRIIKGDKGANEVWDLIKQYQRDPKSVTYIWALTGKMFSLEAYNQQKQKSRDQVPEIIQIDYLLMYTWAAVQSIGAKFILFFDKKA